MARRLRALGLVVLLTLALGAFLGVRALSAQRHLEAARTSLERARALLLDRDVEGARAQITAAGEQTRRARSLTGDPAWRAVSAVPVAGSSFAEVRSLAADADDLAREVLPSALTAADGLRGGSLRTADGSFDLELLARLTPRVTQSVTAAERIRDRLAGPADGQLLVEPVRTARAQLAGQVTALADSLQAAARALELAPALLGADRPRRFFVLVQQPGESRGTGGLVGGYAVLEASKGRVRVTRQGSNADLRPGTVAVPDGVPADYVEQYSRNGAFDLWPNVNLSPDLPVVARVVAARWKAQGGGELDGVIALDPLALSMLLEGGPALPVGGRAIAPGELLDYLAVGQYVGVPADGPQDARKDQLAAVAAIAARRLSGGEGDPEALLRGLIEAVRSGHLRMASDDPALGPALAAAGVDGALPDGTAPLAYPVVINATAGKLDHFLDRRLAYTAGPCTDDSRRSTIVVELTNRAPATGLPPYLTQRNSVAGGVEQTTDGGVVLQVYLTPGAVVTAATLDGSPVGLQRRPDGAVLQYAEEGGLPMSLVLLGLPRDTTRTLRLEVDEPPLSGEPVVPEQPLDRPLVRDVSIVPC